MEQFLEVLAKQKGFSEILHRSIDFGKLATHINEIFKRAHTFYLNAAKNGQMDNESCHDKFSLFLEYEKVNGFNQNDFYSKLAYEVIKLTIKSKIELAIDHFKSNPMGNYDELVQSSLSHLDYNRDCLEEVLKGLNSYDAKPEILRDAALGVPLLCTDNQNTIDKLTYHADSLLCRSISDDMLDAITSFANSLGIFCHKLSSQLMYDFLCCRKGICLQVNKVCTASFLFLQLSKTNIIRNEWAKITTTNGMLANPSGAIITDAHTLTASASRIANKKCDSLSDIEKRIFDFTDKLQLGRKM